MTDEDRRLRDGEREKFPAPPCATEKVKPKCIVDEMLRKAVIERGCMVCGRKQPMSKCWTCGRVTLGMPDRWVLRGASE